METSDRDSRHKARMIRKKAVIDEKIEQANQEKGLLLILTGNGKGKSSSAFGMVARSLGHGMCVGVAQFIKGRSDTGEEAFFRQHPAVTWHVLGEGFTWNTQDRQRDTETAMRGWQIVAGMLQDPAIQLVVLDAIAKRPPMQHVVITGRGASEALRNAADTVSELMDVKHAWRAGIKAQAGIDL